MKLRTSDLQGVALDWAVWACEKPDDEFLQQRRKCRPYSTDWAQGGPIIEREKIDLFTEKGTPESWCASVARDQNGHRLVGWRLHQYGPTPLIAAMRCYVASRLGDEVEVPTDLAA